MAMYQRPPVISSCNQAQELLLEGNRRYVGGQILNQDLSQEKRTALVRDGQQPFAVVVTCSDSRVPPEIIFDQGLGDLFVVRTAGNVLDDIALGSVEYGVEHLGAPLVLVMGHEHCGAVKAAVDHGEAPGGIGAIINKISPLVEKAKSMGTAREDLYTAVEDDNIRNTINEISKSEIIQHLLHEGKVTLMGVKYRLSTGDITVL